MQYVTDFRPKYESGLGLILDIWINKEVAWVTYRQKK